MHHQLKSDFVCISFVCPTPNERLQASCSEQSGTVRADTSSCRQQLRTTSAQMRVKHIAANRAAAKGLHTGTIGRSPGMRRYTTQLPPYTAAGARTLDVAIQPPVGASFEQKQRRDRRRILPHSFSTVYRHAIETQAAQWADIPRERKPWITPYLSPASMPNGLRIQPSREQSTCPLL